MSESIFYYFMKSLADEATSYIHTFNWVNFILVSINYIQMHKNKE